MAIQKTYPVRSRVEIDGKNTSKVVGEAKFFEFENLAEAVSTLTEPVALGLINTQHKTNEMNKIRAEFAGGPSIKQLTTEAMVELSTTRLADLQACAGDGEKVNALIASIVAEKKANFEKERQARLAALPSSTDDEENGQ